jgi:hypothetical protein
MEQKDISERVSVHPASQVDVWGVVVGWGHCAFSSASAWSHIDASCVSCNVKLLGGSAQCVVSLTWTLERFVPIRPPAMKLATGSDSSTYCIHLSIPDDAVEVKQAVSWTGRSYRAITEGCPRTSSSSAPCATLVMNEKALWKFLNLNCLTSSVRPSWCSTDQPLWQVSSTVAEDAGV